MGTDVAPAPVGLIESQDDASPPNMAVMTTAISTGESNVSNSGPQGKEENASPSSSTSPTSPVSQPIELPKGGAPDENQIQETDEASHSFSKTKDEVLLKFLSTGDVDRKRSQKVLIEFSGHKFWLGAATATYLLCFCLAAEFDDGKILNTGRTSRGLNLSGYLSGSATQPKNFNVKRLGKICYEIIGYLYKGVNSKPYFFTCGGKDYSVGDLFPKVGDKKADDRGKRFVIPPGTLGPFGGPKNSYFGTSVGGPYQ